MPKDVLWRFRAELDDTSQIDMTAHIDVELGTAQNHRLGSWKRSQKIFCFRFVFVLFLMQQYNINKVDWKGKQLKKKS